MSSLCSLTNFLCNGCPDPQTGRISAIAFVQTGIPVVDPTQVQTWTDLIGGGYATIVTPVRGTYDGGTAVDGPGYGRVPNRRQSANHSITYNHLYSCDNVTFYNELNQSNRYQIFYTNGVKLWNSGVSTMISAMAPITDNTADTLEFQVTVTWSNILLSNCYECPPIFDSCEMIERFLVCFPPQPILITC